MKNVVLAVTAIAAIAASPAAANDAAANGVYERMQSMATAPDPTAVVEKIYAPQATYLPGHKDLGIEPRDRVVKMMAGSQQHLRKAGGAIDLKFRVVERKRFGDVIVDNGYMRRAIRMSKDAPEQVSYSKFVTVIARQPDGNWAFVSDADSDTPAANFDNAVPTAGLKFDV